ncbi:MAG: hypothetical protein FWF83_08530 [Clostridiales bacterium]|nr:hypothetical protein [Clostridiales bacterium]
MEQLTAYVLSMIELIEKELQLFKILSVKTFKGLGLFAVGVFLAGAGILMLAWTCFHAVIALVGPVTAGLATSVLILTGGGALLWMSKKCLK